MTSADGFSMLLSDLRQVKEMIEQLSRQIKVAQPAPSQASIDEQDGSHPSEYPSAALPSGSVTINNQSPKPQSSSSTSSTLVTPKPQPIRPSVQTTEIETENPFESQPIYTSPTSMTASRSSSNEIPDSRPRFTGTHRDSIPVEPMYTRLSSQSSQSRVRGQSYPRSRFVSSQPPSQPFIPAIPEPSPPPARQAPATFSFAGAMFHGNVTQNSIQGNQISNTTTNNSNPVNCNNTTTITTTNSYNRRR